MTTDRPAVPEAFAAAYPELADLAAAAPDPVYLVGGAVRDLLAGRGRADVDLAVEGDPRALAAALGAEVSAEHSRFGTLKLEWGGETIDVAATRRERYARPGALPTVEIGAPIRTDLARRDFTVNAMAIPLADPGELLDPYDGQADLRAGELRVIHAGSFVDDPTRALRAARYASRFGFGIEAGTRELLLATDLGTVTPERRATELRRLASEADATRGIELLAGWGLIELRPGGESLALARDVNRLLAKPPWSAEADRPSAILAAALARGPAGAGPSTTATSTGPGADSSLAAGRAPFEALATARPSRPSEGVALAAGVDPIDLVLARAAGAEWLDDWLGWREVRLEIDGTDLAAEGLSGPAIGEALAAALRAKLDGEASTRADELRIALAAGTVP
jgi:tRNA nucleotidyltransferase (CCA-adding enzyme)